MITAAALCPAPPLLVRELTGAEDVGADLRAACLAAVAGLLASQPDVLAVVGAGETTRTWDPLSELDLAVFAPGAGAPGPVPAGSGSLDAARPGGPAPAGSGPAGSPDLPPALGIGAWLLTQAGYKGERVLQSVSQDDPAARCAEVGAVIADLAGRVALLVMADGSARRGLKAPGYLDERSAAFDAEVERAVRGGDLAALLSVDAGLARELMATGRPGWHVLAGALGSRRVATEVRYCGDPFGVAYLVASLRIS
ncbi:MAG TPA: hypothetical protein VF834_05380 [Streptosporangiaceae bacterium]